MPAGLSYNVQAYGSGWIVADLSGNRGANGVAYSGSDGVWHDQPADLEPFETLQDAAAFSTERYRDEIGLNPSSACGILTVLTGYQQAILAELGRQFNSLRRLAEILEKAADFTFIFDDLIRIIPHLLPLEGLTINTYNQIRAACPMLHLPEANIDRLAEFETNLARAYSELLRKLDLHQYNRLDELEARLDAVIGKALNALGRDWVTCAQIICDETQNLTFESIRNNVKLHVEIKNQIAEGQLPGNTRTPFTVVSESGAQKVELLKDQRAQIAALAASSKPDIQAIISRQAL